MIDIESEFKELSDEYKAICAEYGERYAHTWVHRAMRLMEKQNELINQMRES